MPPKQTGIGAYRLRKGILGSFDGILYLWLRDRPFFPGLDLKGHGIVRTKQHHTESIDQLAGHRIHVLYFAGHRVADHQPLCRSSIHRFLRPQQRLYHKIRDIRAGYQAVYGIDPNLLSVRSHQNLSHIKISGALKNGTYVFMGHRNRINWLRSWMGMMVHALHLKVRMSASWKIMRVTVYI